MADDTKDDTADPKSDWKGFKKQFELGARAWKRNGGQGAFVPYSLMFRMLGAGKKKKDEDDAGDGSGDTTPPPVTPATRPKSNSWPDIVANYFPNGAGTQYKDGGLVRGGGKAVKGRGRGKFV